jgi:hypothetical protein
MEPTLDSEYLNTTNSGIVHRLIRSHKTLKKFLRHPLTDQQIINGLKECHRILALSEDIFQRDFSQEKSEIMLIILQINIFQYSNERLKENPENKIWWHIWQRCTNKGEGKIILTKK